MIQMGPSPRPQMLAEPPVTEIAATVVGVGVGVLRRLTSKSEVQTPPPETAISSKGERSIVSEPEPTAAVARAGRESTVTVIGEIDIATAPAMQRLLLHALDSGPADLVVDMAQCGFLDCSGLGVLVGVANASRSRGGNIALRAPGYRVVRVRDLAGLHDVLPTEPPAIPGPTA
jgi:anti-sigma B factor antagonist